ncbi:aminoacetone oxidase family FAD-binding enzyme [Rhodovibrio sodomensis]|uniref:Aminoacetone oxidase family FAD-binding enzyme n=2 Tax=Rhodovibrio sodomensis TaxID=1088 RepID=A0ABS1DNB9_9PROT|nr:NAD(P)/FAD-dependent oxidoreductase [Rhodovibrio sodomensis]MBK1671209.1 aminoacetone oxidase family FAD-binding enzyme [Rhodovibrio sodomensis]
MSDRGSPDTANRPARYDAVVLGGGAAGLMCALTAGARGRRVALVEHMPEVGKKILISGGGRCNFTNLEVRPDRFLSKNPHFAKSALSRYTQWDFISLVSDHGIAWHEKTLGQLFCDHSARQIVDLLLRECAQAGVAVLTSAPVRSVERAPEPDGGFTVRTDSRTLSAPSVVLATGGPSIPKLGATAFAYELARDFGLPLIEPRPALVPLTLGPDDKQLAAPLSGVAVDSAVSANGVRFREATLFTHRGVSGPAVLQASSYWQAADLHAGAHPGGRKRARSQPVDPAGLPVHFDLLPAVGDPDWLVAAKAERPRQQLATVLAEVLPQRLAQRLAQELAGQLADGQGARPLAEWPDRELRAIVRRLKDWQLVPAGTEGFAKAEVTVGGVDTAALDSRTMQARAVPGLYVIGEAVDVTGWLGGYNFQWAWSSGWAAGQAV